MSAILAFIVGAALGYGAHYLQVTPGKIDEIRDLFRKK